MTRSPQYGADYDIGWIFFVHETGLIADGIDWFERWARRDVERAAKPLGSVGASKRFEPNNAPTLSTLQRSTTVTHTGVVAGDNVCIEAHWRTGVAKGFLDKYPAEEIIFRRPRGWAVTTGIHIAAAAACRLGSKYNKALILSQLLANTFIGHFVNRLCRGWVNDKVSAWLDHKNQFICSELSACALAEQPQYRGQGVLAQPLDTISPQMLFDCEELWEKP